MRVDGSPTMRSYLRFDLSSLSGDTISAVTLMIYANSSLDDGFSINGLSDDSWKEDQITYENAPSPGSILTRSGSVSEGHWVSIDLTRYVASPGVLDLVFTPSSDIQLNLASRESGEHAPQLIISYSASSTATATSTSTPTTTATSTPTITSTPTETPTATPTQIAPTLKPASLTFNPVADAYVDDSEKSENNGSGPYMLVDHSPVMRSYIRFNLLNMSSDPITAVTLKLYSNSQLDEGFTVNQLSDSSWQENTIDYRNAPSPGADIVQSGPVAANQWVSIDLSSYVAGPGIYDLVLTPLSNTRLNLATRESGDHAPQLIVSYNSSGSPSPTKSPTSTLTFTPTISPSETTTFIPTITPSLTATIINATNTPTPTATIANPTNTLTPTATTANPTKTLTSTATIANPTKAPTPTATIANPTITPTPSATGASGQVPAFSHVFVIIFENHEYSSVVGSSSWSNFNSLAAKYTLLTQSYAVAHPSLPNYLALTSGSTQGITSDCNTCYVNATNIADLIEGSGRTWKAYMESMPSACYLGNSGDYAQKHNPFVYFDDIRTNSARCQSDDVSLTQFDTDLANNKVPNFVWITPNLCNDGHDCSASTADGFLGYEVSKIFTSPAFDQNSLLVITFDEGSSNASCCGLPSSAGGHIATLLISDLVKTGYQDATPYSHYSILKTIADSWGLSYLVHVGDSATNSIVAPWK